MLTKTMMLRLGMAAVMMTAQGALAAGRDTLSFKVESEALGYSEPVSIRNFINDFDQALGPGSDASAVIRGAATIGYGRWRLGRVYQDLYDVRASRDTARLYHRIANDLPFDAGETFRADLSVSFARTLGWRAAYVFGLSQFGYLELGVTRWHGMRLTDGSLNGQAAADGTENYQYTGMLDYYYEEDSLFERPERGANGYGWGFDLTWSGQWQQWTWQLEGHNLFATINWNDALHTSGQFSSATEQVDREGRSTFNPTLTGREDRRDFRQRLPMDGKLRIVRGIGNYDIGVSSQHLASGTNLVLELGRRWTRIHAGIGLMTMPELGAGVELSGYGLTMRVLADSPALPKARWADARLGWAYAF